MKGNIPSKVVLFLINSRLSMPVGIQFVELILHYKFVSYSNVKYFISSFERTLIIRYMNPLALSLV